MQHVETVIVGAGLSGLALADRLVAAGRDVAILEARPRVGGRILTFDVGGASFDLGPAWFWPGQPRIAALIRQLGLRPFQQHATGDLMFEDETGAVHRGRGFASMEGAFRLDGGVSRLTEGLAQRLPQGVLQAATQVTGLARSGDVVTVATEAGPSYEAKQVVLALPPRLAAGLVYSPEIRAAVRAMAQVPTWMGGQAKAIAVYTRSFWREAGLSGDAMSRRGPLVEIHDASTADGEHHALFGFIGVPPKARRDATALRPLITAQLVRLFGDAAAEPTALHIKDWARDPLTATAADLVPLAAHPSYGLPPAMRDLWDGRLIFAGTEVAPQFGGFLEGALEAADTVFDALMQEKV